MRTLICGSIAYDTIMVFQDKFKNHILPDHIHILNVAFLVPDMRREYGGTAGNIAYNLKLLGGDPLIMATVGDDSQPYLARLDSLQLSRECVREIPDTFTAQAFITTDLDDNQITAFHPGAMNHAHLNHIVPGMKLAVGIISPDGRDGMLQHAQEFVDTGVPFIFDPGQGLPMFDGADLNHFISLADYVAVNSYEAKLLCERTGKTPEQIAKQVKALVITEGSAGSNIYADGQCHVIPSVRADAVVDPTGCGDAYRAGLLYGIANGFDWIRTGQLASVMGAIKIASRGGQNHAPTREQIETIYLRNFGTPLWS